MLGIIEDRFSQLSEHRQQHILRVAKMMKELAAIHHLSPTNAQLAAMGHDLAREMSRDVLTREAKRLGLELSSPEREEPVLLHGPVAALWLQQANIGEPEVWEAIRYHTTAAPRLSPLAKALFIADGIEPGRRFETRTHLEHVAKEKSLDEAYVLMLKETMKYLESRRLKPHPLMIEALRLSEESS
ncbi:MAG: phosphohydrolase [Sulfobacillus benefaciens]|uniref:bis(5'-nucleosyl)-tetraphosphatase (symmetrical) n=1 Tax=Sulfobacillus benefaciens TaxID=453960 RepID=A0A2T2WZY5_9FIRM|nr:MAG: phosphohydrolase [Sulfobacillus benefaciens]